MSALTTTMSTSVTTAPHAAAPVTRPPAKSAVAGVALRRQVGEWLAKAGFGRFEALFLAGVGVLIMASAFLIMFVTIFGNPAATRWAHRLVSTERGFWATLCLLIGSGAMAWALVNARRSVRIWVRIPLFVAVLAGAAYFVVLALDYDALAYRGLLPGGAFRPNERWVARQYGIKLPRKGAPSPASVAPLALRQVDARNGRRLFLGTCSSCHGPHGEGMPGQGKDLRISEFVAGADDAQLLKFVIAGRQPWDPANTTKVAMPGRGGNPMLSDADLQDVVAFLRELQKTKPTPVAASAGSQTASSNATPGDAASSPARTAGMTMNASPSAAQDRPPAELFVPAWNIPEPPPGPAGLNPKFWAALTDPVWQPPVDAQAFFAGYFGATSIVGIHVLLALAAAAVLLATRRNAGESSHRAPLFLGALLWWWTTASWLLMFPLLYVLG